MTSCILTISVDKEWWDIQIAKLLRIFNNGQSVNDDAMQFLAFDELSQSELSKPTATNHFDYEGGVPVNVGTIHSVKGETHDATLLLETKYDRYYDVQECIPWLLDAEKQKPIENLQSPRSKSSIQAGFMKKLYVGASRPRYLLCIAMNADRITNEQISQITEAGWRIDRLPNRTTAAATSLASA